MKWIDLSYLIVCMIVCMLPAGCSPSERPLNVGVDQCEYCLMTVSDERYGGEVVLTTGKVLPFDSVECLAAYLNEQPVEAHSIWVVDYMQPGLLIPVEQAAFVQSEALRSPMGMNLTAFSAEAAADRPVKGRWMNWAEVRELVKAEGAHAHPHGLIDG